MQLQGKNILITGGASGIGKLMAEIALKKGAAIILWDINEKVLSAVANELEQYGKVYKIVVDLNQKTSIDHAFSETLALKIPIHILINNAGIVVGKYFHEHSAEDIFRTMQINGNAPMYLTHLFLPILEKNLEAHICNIASSAGLISNPKMSVYAASKWAVLGFSDSLFIEMKKLKKNIHITTVTPFYISTGMFNGVKSIVPIIKPETAAKKIIRGIEKNKRFVSMPWTIRMIRFLQTIFSPSAFDRVIGEWGGIYHTMDEFKGRS